MSGQNAFDPKNIVDLRADKEGRILDALNIPPKVADSIRKNARNLQVAAICAFVVLLGWTYYNYHTGVQKDKATALLSRALDLKDKSAQKKMLARVVDEYPRT